MRWAQRLGWTVLGVMMIPAGCSNDGAATDGGADAFISCASSTDCPTGTECLYPASAGCSATRRCLPSGGTACKGALACSCTGVTVGVCNGGAPMPVRSLGACEGGCAASGGCNYACELTDVSGYTPAPMSAPVASPNACTPTEISDFVAACYGPSATQQTCDGWQAAEADAGSCLGCVYTLRSSSAWGPLVCVSTSCSQNTAGCVDLELGQVSQEKQAGGASSCGDLISDLDGCVDYSCATCSTTGGASSDFAKCASSAQQNECKSFAGAASSAAQCAALHDDAGTTNVLKCFPQSDTDLASFVDVFCGGGP